MDQEHRGGVEVKGELRRQDGAVVVSAAAVVFLQTVGQGVGRVGEKIEHLGNGGAVGLGDASQAEGLGEDEFPVGGLFRVRKSSERFQQQIAVGVYSEDRSRPLVRGTGIFDQHKTDSFIKKINPYRGLPAPRTVCVQNQRADNTCSSNSPY